MGMYYMKRSAGFTVVEIAVVIVVIGILVSMTAIGYRKVQDQARGAEVSTALKAVESALHTFHANQNRENWVNNATFSGTTASVSLSTILAPSYVPPAGSTQEAVLGLRRQLPQGIPTVDGFEGISWTYHNQGNTRATTECNTTTNGVVILLTGVPQAVFTQMDEATDDAQVTCGKLRYNTSTGQLVYQLGFTQSVTN